jgi:transposase
MMGRKAIEVKKQANVKELKARYRASTCAVERRRLQAVWQLTEGKERQEVLALTAYSPKSLVDIIKRYNEGGIAGLQDKRHDNPGAPPLLSDEQLLHLAQLVRKDYAKGVLWNGQKVITWLKEEYQQEVYPQRAYEYLKQISMSQQVPRPRHRKADEVVQDIFKKNAARSRQ